MSSGYKCIWVLDKDMNVYETGCSNLFYLSDGDLKENDIKYCCYCGRKIIEQEEFIL